MNVNEYINKKHKSLGVNKNTHELADFIKSCASATVVTDLEDSSYPYPEDKWSEIYIEYLYLFAHILYRVAFVKFGIEKRNSLQDRLGPVLAMHIAESFYDKAILPEATNAVLREMGLAEQDYSECIKSRPERDDLLSNNALSVVLSKRICKIIYGNEDGDTVIGIGFKSMDVVTNFEIALTHDKKYNSWITKA